MRDVGKSGPTTYDLLQLAEHHHRALQGIPDVAGRMQLRATVLANERAALMQRNDTSVLDRWKKAHPDIAARYDRLRAEQALNDRAIRSETTITHTQDRDRSR